MAAKADKMPVQLWSFYVAAVLAGVTVALPAAAQVTPVPIANGGFEGTYATLGECPNITGQVAPGWSDNTCWDSTRPVIRYARDAVNPHSGASSQRITLASGVRVQFAQFLAAPFEAGKRYTVTLWLRAQAPMFVTALLRQTNAPYAGYTNKLIKLSTAWQRFDFAGLTDNTEVGILLSAQTAGTFWVDDVSVQSEPSSLATASPPAGAIPKTYFGMHLNRADTPWPQVGSAIGAVRIWDAGANLNGSGVGAQWSEVNGSAGFYDWSGLDARVAAALARGADVLYTLGGRTPQWAAAQPNANSPYGPGQCSEPASDLIWQDWVRTIATRYKGKIKYWEVWNEPDLPSFYCATPEKLIDLARLAHSVLKQVDPANQVLSPGFSGIGGPGYLDFFLSQGGGQYADIVSYHFYADLPETNAGAYTANLKSVLQRYSAHAKPLWNTEQGWVDIPNATQLPPATGAAYVARAYLLHWAYGVSRYYYYTWDNQWNQFAFAQADRSTLAPAGVAYREIAGWLTGKVMQSLSVDASDTYTVTLRAANGQQQRVLWNPRQTVQFALPAAWGVNSKRELTGAQSAVSTASIAVGATPIMLSGAQGPSAGEVILDNLPAGVTDPTSARIAFGKWCGSSTANHYGVDSVQSCGVGLDTYRWTPTLPSTGQYSVYLWWGASPSNSKSVSVMVRYAGGTRTLAFDQTNVAGQWVLHGTYRFLAGKSGFVQMNDANGVAHADAIRFVREP